MRMAGSPWTAYVLGRVGIAALSLVLLGLAIRVFWDGTLPSVAVFGLSLAVTPMAVFLASSLSASGAETAAAVCYVAGLLGLARGRRAAGPVWLAIGAGGTVLAISRSLGPYFILAAAGAVAVSVGFPEAWRRLRAGGRAAVAAGACIAVASALNQWWEATQMPHLSWRASLLAKATLEPLPRVGREMVGVFGWLEAGLPGPVYALWAVLTLSLVVLALALGRWRERLAVVGLIAGCVALVAAFHAVLLPQSGFDIQGRHFLPLAVAVPLLAADVVLRQRHRVRVRILATFAALGAVATGAVQGFAWYVNARRYAVGISGPNWFIARADWSPPGGWAPWVVVAFAGAICLVVGGVRPALPSIVGRRRARLEYGAAPAGEPLVGVD
jgi:hypothetical protein